MTAAVTVSRLAHSRLTVGQAVQLALADTAAVRFAANPGKPGAAGSHGGMASFKVRQAGHYRVALSTAAWIDIVRGGRSVASTGHERGPACSGIHKIVDFTLSRGTNVLQVSGSDAAQATILVTKIDS